MFLVNMLYAEVLPLGQHKPSPEVKAKPKRDFAKTNEESVKIANAARHKKSWDRYKAVMGLDTWVSTNAIEQKLGTGRGCVLPSLAKWEKKGFAKKRKKGDPKSWTRQVGMEWKLVGTHDPDTIALDKT